MLTNPAVFSL